MIQDKKMASLKDKLYKEQGETPKPKVVEKDEKLSKKESNKPNKK